MAKRCRDCTLWYWKYNDRSDPKLPSRNIKWEFGIPYILLSEGSLFWKGHSFHLAFLIFGLDYITDIGCGKSIKFGFKKWFWHFSINRGWTITIYIGFSWLRYMNWSIRRSFKKMTPGQRQEFKDMLK